MTANPISYVVVKDGTLIPFDTLEAAEAAYRHHRDAYKPEYQDRVTLSALVPVLPQPAPVAPVVTAAPDLTARIEALCEVLRQAGQARLALDDDGVTPLLGHDYYKFFVDPDDRGVRFTRIIMSAGGSRSVHAFVEKSTGLLCKAAGWKAPAKRASGALASFGSLLDDADFARLLNTADPHGSYLYVR